MTSDEIEKCKEIPENRFISLVELTNVDVLTHVINQRLPNQNKVYGFTDRAGLSDVESKVLWRMVYGDFLYNEKRLGYFLDFLGLGKDLSKLDSDGINDLTEIARDTIGLHVSHCEPCLDLYNEEFVPSKNSLYRSLPFIVTENGVEIHDRLYDNDALRKLIDRDYLRISSDKAA